MGILNAEEAKKVESKLAQYPELNEAYLEALSTMGDMAQIDTVSPRTEWKNDILAAALAKGKSTTETVVKTLDTTTSESNNRYSYLAIAASVVLLISLGLNIYQFQSMNDLRGYLLETNLRLSEMEADNQVMVTNYYQMEKDLEIMRDPMTSTFMMMGVDGMDEDYQANIYWNAKSEMAYLDVKNLPNAPKGMEYQLWALKDGKPVDMGMFHALDTHNFLKEMGQIPGADAFAVTLEPEGGSENPNMDEMYVMGKVLTPA